MPGAADGIRAGPRARNRAAPGRFHGLKGWAKRRMIDDDAQLMLAFKAGDREAFEALFRRYTPRLMNFVARMVRDRARAEELVQDVFVKVYNAAPRYEPRARFSTWIFGIAHNAALNDLARAHRQRERSAEENAYPEPVDPTPHADLQVEARHTADRIERALERLPERQRAALLLRSEQGLDYRDIAETLDASVASVKSLLHRAREALLAELKGVVE